MLPIEYHFRGTVPSCLHTTRLSKQTVDELSGQSEVDDLYRTLLQSFVFFSEFDAVNTIQWIFSNNNNNNNNNNGNTNNNN